MQTPRVLYEDNHLFIVEKPVGWLVQGDKTGDPTLTDWGRDFIKAKYNKPGEVFLHPTHRLDRPVGGLVVLARTSKSLERMNKLFRDDAVQKTYLAIVHGRPKNMAGTLTHWLEKDSAKNRVKAYTSERTNAKKAILMFECLAFDEGFSLVRVFPKTGRSHQIRVQLAAMGTPIAGDLKYGGHEPNPDKSISLHAFRLTFAHPVKKEIMTWTNKPSSANWKHFEPIIHALD
ncbi:MAG: RluA family pseudouridine synthase [Cyclobacteriaceae bacterium]|nr:RluA family pseudouridine synthase [Cyclobacteriaceae bacterium]